MKPSREDGEDEEGGPLAEEQEEKRWTSTDTPEAEADNVLKHKSVFVEEVLDNPRIYYFGLTRPGSYIAVSVEFNDVANAESVTALSKWLKGKREKEEKISFSGEQIEETSGTTSPLSSNCSARICLQLVTFSEIYSVCLRQWKCLKMYISISVFLALPYALKLRSKYLGVTLV